MSSTFPPPPTNLINTWIPSPFQIVFPYPQLPLTPPSEGVIGQLLPCTATTPFVTSNTPTDTSSLSSAPTLTPFITNTDTQQPASLEHVLIPTHSMTTRSKNQIHKPNQKLNPNT